MQTDATSANYFQRLTGFKLYATSANIVVVPCKRTQQVTTLLGPTMLGPFAWAKRFDWFQTIRNKCQQFANTAVVSCKRTQQFTTLLGPTMLGVVGQQ